MVVDPVHPQRLTCTLPLKTPRSGEDWQPYLSKYDREERSLGEGVRRSVVGAAWHPFSGDESTTGKAPLLTSLAPVGGWMDGDGNGNRCRATLSVTRTTREVSRPGARRPGDASGVRRRWRRRALEVLGRRNGWKRNRLVHRRLHA
jgi:hypothetical protein